MKLIFYFIKEYGRILFKNGHREHSDLLRGIRLYKATPSDQKKSVIQVTKDVISLFRYWNAFPDTYFRFGMFLKDYLDEFRESIKNDKLGKGFIISGLYSFKKTTILENKNIIDMNVPQWLLNSMCAVWNSGIQVIYAKDKIGAENYPNAYWHGIKSSGLSDYLSKLVNENE